MTFNAQKTVHEDGAISAFHLTWGNYPEPVMLITKARDILAVNKKAATDGIAAGTKCHLLGGSDQVCKHCKANQALKEGAGIRQVIYSEAMKAVVDGYWIPVEGSDRLYVHFANNISDYAKAEMFPANG